MSTTTNGTTNGSADDICPVCKTIRYLNKDMVFLINPACYHPMCSNCVARIFAGPNQCPYAGCHQTLRRKDFRKAFFEDLGVEREVDVRRRVAAVFNQTEDDFDSLDAYNEYLERVESLTMDLIGPPGKQHDKAVATLAAWEADHRAEIERNRRRGERQDELGKARRAAEQDAARQRRLAAQKQDRDEKQARIQARAADLDALAKAPAADRDGGKAVGRILLRRRGQQKVDQEAASLLETIPRDELTIRGLKSKKQTAAATTATSTPYNPLAGLDPPPTRFRVHDDPPGYRNPWLQGARDHNSHTVGGYDVHDYCARALFEAFAGLAVFVDDEKETRKPVEPGSTPTASGVATVGASMAAGME